MRWALVAILLAAAPLAAQDSLEAARKLYASAEYEAALGMLSTLRGEAGAGVAIEIDRYRVLCLFALGRADEARDIIDALVAEHPMVSLSTDDMPPRIQSAFNDARRRLLPPIARALYAEGKAAYDRKAFAEAAEKLERTLSILAIPEAAMQAELNDLKTLASGFLDLSRAVATPPTLSPPASASGPPSATPAPARPAASDAAPAPNGVATSGAAVSVLSGPMIEPVVISQTLPPWSAPINGAIEAEFRGAIEVDIDESGNVVGAQIVQPIHPVYDPVLLRASRDWKYQPARRGGQPVRIKKRVEVVLRGR